MPYTPDATDVTQPVPGTVKAATAALEFQTLKLYLRDVILAGIQLKAPLANPVFTGTPVFSTGATFIVAPVGPTAAPGTADSSLATTAFCASLAMSTVLPGAVSGQGLSISSDGVSSSFSLSGPDALSILNYMGL